MKRKMTTMIKTTEKKTAEKVAAVVDAKMTLMMKTTAAEATAEE
jgi:hypothetical protein